MKQIFDDLKMILRNADINCITDAKTFQEQKMRFGECIIFVSSLERREAEIRAMAQREIVKWCFDNKVDFAILERYADKEGVIDCVLKHFTADQLKEEQ